MSGHAWLGILGATLLLGGAAFGCGSDDGLTDHPTGAATSSGTGGAGGKEATSSSTGGAGGQGGEGGEGGSGGGGLVGSKARGTEMVSAGDYVRSQKYTMVYTLGQPTQNQSKTTSQDYRLQGGVIGANGSLP